MTTFREKIRKAREITQRPEVLSHREPPYATFMRRFSIYVSYLFWKLGMTANQVTILMIICSLTGSLSYVLRNIYVNIIGIVLFQLSYFLDHVDGEVARLRKQSSLFGVYLDQVSHIVIEPLFCAIIGIRLYLLQPCTANLLIALLLYSGWHWQREIVRVRVTTLLAKAKIPIEQIKHPPPSKQSRTLVKTIKHCVACFVDEIHAKTIAGVALLFSYWHPDILKYFCLVHAVLIILFCLRQMRIDIRELPQYEVVT